MSSESRGKERPQTPVDGNDSAIADGDNRHPRGARATVRGKWDMREFVPKWNAIISLVKEHGPETLVEIQWHDTDKVLVLDGEAFRFYPTSLM